MKTRSNFEMYIPAIFCAIISGLTLFMGSGDNPGFLAFLPMCFFFTAQPLITMNKRLAVLEEMLSQADEGAS